MRFQYPGFNVALVTAIWLLLGFGTAWVGITGGTVAWYMIVASHISVVAAGMWFRIRYAGYAFSVVSLILGIAGVLVLILMPNARSLKRGIVALGNFYAGYVAWDWARKLED